jgi:hypothetical protein
MKASELIRVLQDAIEKHGDLPVAYFDQEWNCAVVGMDISTASRGPFLALEGDRGGME